jgi:hypothetical protein
MEVLKIDNNKNVPLGGICSAGLIRMMIDIDSWLQSGDNRSPYALACTPDTLWRSLLAGGGGGGHTDRTCTGERVYFLPENTHSPKNIRFVSRALVSALPPKITELSSDTEKTIIRCFLGEVNDTFGFSLDTDPSLSRKNIAACKQVHNRRFVVIGASHVKRIAGGLVAKGHKVVDLSVSGWKVDNTSAAQISKRLMNLSLMESDIVVLDPLTLEPNCH